MISASIVCDSVSPEGKRLTTFKLRYPKFIHSEFMTHRVISRNASSSRAIPTAKLLEEVRSDVLRAAPVFWGKNQPGMQAAEELEYKPWSAEEGYSDRERARLLWQGAAVHAADWAEEMVTLGVHKQIVNRVLEPFSHINVVATATEWNNFFGLRLHEDAQPEMRALAVAMWEARKASEPKQLKPEDWHTPFADYTDGWLGRTCERCAGHGQVLYKDDEVERACGGCGGTGEAYDGDVVLKVSVARCARVSYESHETGKRSTVEEDLKLFERLKASGHWSPFEHQATPDVFEPGTAGADWLNPSEHGNFVGWRQYRKTLPGEACAPLPLRFTRETTPPDQAGTA